MSSDLSDYRHLLLLLQSTEIDRSSLETSQKDSSLSLALDLASKLYRESLNAYRSSHEETTALRDIVSVLSSILDLRSGLESGKKRECLDSLAEERKSAVEDMILHPAENRALKFTDVAGLEQAKQALREAIVYPLLYPDVFVGVRQPWRLILMYGPPGTGKSRLAEAVAGETGARFYRLSSTDLISSWQGQSERLVRELFNSALLASGSKAVVMFVDEIDSLCRARCSKEEDSTRRIKTELLVQMQRLQESRLHAYMLCATNCPWELDAAFLRRFQKRLYVSLPDVEAREKMLRAQTDGMAEIAERDWRVLAERTEGFSGNDLRCLTQDALYAPVREIRGEGTGLRKVVVGDFNAALERTARTVGVELLRQYEEFTRMFGMMA